MAATVEDILRVITTQGLEGLGRYYSVYPGIVLKNEDPEGYHRIKVWVPSVRDIRLWALPRGQQGSLRSGIKYLAPEPGETVWVSFEGGDLAKPLWEPHSWTKNEVPLALDDVHTMGFVTPNGSQATIDDESHHAEVYINGWAGILSEDNLCLGSKQGNVEVNSGNNGGVINIQDLTDKLNQLVREIEELKMALNTHTHTSTPTGGPTSTPLVPHNKTFTTFNKSDYEDTKFTH